MGTAFLYGNGGSGGGGLNFSVVGGTAAPNNPKENMIWINTDQKITSWVFSATEPTIPVEGMVWIAIGTSSTMEFNALKKNGIQIYPISAKQYVSGTWVNKTVKIYQNDEWVCLATYLFKSGKGAIVPFSYMTTTYPNFKISVGTEKIKVTNTDTSQLQSHFLYTTDPINLANATTVYIRYKVDVTQYGHAPLLVVNTNKWGSTEYTGLTARQVLTVDSKEHIDALDVSTLSGSYYIGTNGVAAIEIYDLWFS